MRTLLLIAVTLVLSAAAFGQTPAPQAAPQPCTLRIDRAPVVRGVKLGMSVDDLLALFPGSAEKVGIQETLKKSKEYPNFGVFGLSLMPREYPTKDRFEGIRTLEVQFVDGAITDFRVNYYFPPQGPSWPRLDDFITKVAAAYRLPPATDWTREQYQVAEKSLKCDGFRVDASNLNLAGSMAVSRPERAFTTRSARQEEFEEKVRQSFKP